MMEIEISAVLTEDDLLNAYMRASESKDVELLKALIPYTSIPASMIPDTVSWNDEARVNCRTPAPAEDPAPSAEVNDPNEPLYTSPEKEEEDLPAVDTVGVGEDVEPKGADEMDVVDLSALTDTSQFTPPRNEPVKK